MNIRNCIKFILLILQLEIGDENELYHIVASSLVNVSMQN
jgi:hypothetical protein